MTETGFFSDEPMLMKHKLNDSLDYEIFYPVKPKQQKTTQPKSLYDYVIVNSRQLNEGLQQYYKEKSLHSKLLIMTSPVYFGTTGNLCRRWMRHKLCSAPRFRDENYKMILIRAWNTSINKAYDYEAAFHAMKAYSMHRILYSSPGTFQQQIDAQSFNSISNCYKEAIELLYNQLRKYFLFILHTINNEIFSK